MPPALTPTQSLHLSKFSKAYKILGWGGNGTELEAEIRARSLISFTLDPARKTTHHVAGCCGFLFFPLNHPYDFRQEASKHEPRTWPVCAALSLRVSISAQTQSKFRHSSKVQKTKNWSWTPDHDCCRTISAATLLCSHKTERNTDRERERERERERHRHRENDTNARGKPAKVLRYCAPGLTPHPKTTSRPLTGALNENNRWQKRPQRSP
jgi:hypothetical protein